jgi:hypothetical protein
MKRKAIDVVVGEVLHGARRTFFLTSVHGPFLSTYREVARDVEGRSQGMMLTYTRDDIHCMYTGAVCLSL